MPNPARDRAAPRQAASTRAFDRNVQPSNLLLALRAAGNRALSGLIAPQRGVAVQAMMGDDDLPAYLYHATPRETLPLVAEGGLKALSVGGSDKPYLCMSGVEDGATTLQRRASDIVFRVASSRLNAQDWKQSGAGKQEWRSFNGIPPGLLEYRRFLGTTEQKTWRKLT
jgi:RNA:NAD 2'-phosphotransferase (TPT1/KptA family)